MSSSWFCSLAIVSLLLVNALAPANIFSVNAAPSANSVFRAGTAYGPNLYSGGNFGGGSDVYGTSEKSAAPAPRSAYGNLGGRGDVYGTSEKSAALASLAPRSAYGGYNGYGASPSYPPSDPFAKPVTYYGKPIPLPSWKDTTLAETYGNGWGGYQPGFYRPVWEDDYNALVMGIGSSYASIMTSRLIYVPRAPPPVYGDLGALSQHPIISETVARDVLKGTALGDFHLIETPAPTAATTPAPAVNTTVAAALPAEKAIALDAGVASPAAPVSAASVLAAPAGAAITIDQSTAAPAAGSSSVALPAAVGTPGGALPDCSFTNVNPTACANPGTTAESLSSLITVSNKEGGGLTMSISDALAAQPLASAASAFEQKTGSPVMTQEDAAAAQPPASSKISSSFGSSSASASPQQPIINTTSIINPNELEPLEQAPEHPGRPRNNNVVVPTSSSISNVSKMTLQDAGAAPITSSSNAANKVYATADTRTVNNEVQLSSSPQMNVIHIGSDSTLNMTELLHVLSSAKAAGQLNNVNEPTLTIVKQRGPVSSVLTVPTDELKMMGPFGGSHQHKLADDAVPTQPLQNSNVKPLTLADLLSNSGSVLNEQQAQDLMHMKVQHPIFPGIGGSVSTPAGEETTTVASTAATEATTAAPYWYSDNAPSGSAETTTAAATNSDASKLLNQLNSNVPREGPKLISVEFHHSNYSGSSTSSLLASNANIENAAGDGGGAKTIVENRNVFTPTLPPLSLPSQQQDQRQQQQATNDVHFVNGTDAGNAELLSNSQATGVSENSIELHHPSYPGAGIHYINRPAQTAEQAPAVVNNSEIKMRVEVQQQFPTTNFFEPNDSRNVQANQGPAKLYGRLGLRQPAPTFFTQIDDPNAPAQNDGQTASGMNPSNIDQLQQQEQKPFIPSPEVVWPDAQSSTTTTTITTTKPEKDLSVQVVGTTAPLRFGDSKPSTDVVKISKWRQALFPPTNKRDEHSRTRDRNLLTLDDFLQPLVAIKADRPNKSTEAGSSG